MRILLTILIFAIYSPVFSAEIPASDNFRYCKYSWKDLVSNPFQTRNGETLEFFEQITTSKTKDENCPVRVKYPDDGQGKQIFTLSRIKEKQCLYFTFNGSEKGSLSCTLK